VRRSDLAAVVAFVLAGGVFGAPAWIALTLVAVALTPRLV
jgi:hypothetical protein